MDDLLPESASRQSKAEYKLQPTLTIAERSQKFIHLHQPKELQEAKPFSSVYLNHSVTKDCNYF